MALSISNVFHSPKPKISLRNCILKTPVSSFQSSHVRFPRLISWNRRVTICAAASAAGGSNQDSELNPYEVLGVSPIEGFDMVKAAYTKKRKEAERNNDEATLTHLEKAYDKLMMQQLSKRKKGVTFGSIKVSKDIKYADKQPIVPWGPRYTKSSDQDVRINLAISAAFTAWIAVKRYAEYKPLQFLAFAFVYRIFEKLKSFEPAVSPTLTETGEDDGRALRMGKRILRSLALVFSCITIASLGYTGVLNLIEYISGFIPAFLYNNQRLSGIDSSNMCKIQKNAIPIPRAHCLVNARKGKADLYGYLCLSVLSDQPSTEQFEILCKELLVTASSAVMLYIMASYYR
ncbi:hypothetical protein JRO89_XS04G0154700 [Xanthoceras sorbifolium]|uniref:Uncharacterized protein n=1 Tax=Xanthoceras sorbifolium TaxID=99658 RepID=A0ABQ8I5E6_9ROSI|nr:hypothetical protein JRO89_XS04G0154700 [Xanthoceras sorbifolium]